MTNTTEQIVDREKKIEQDLIEKLADKDLTRSYMFFRNFITRNPIEEYITKKKCVEFGKELLPTDLEDKTEQEEIDGIYIESCRVLKKAKPEKRAINFTYRDMGGRDEIYPVYQITSNDANTCDAEREQLKDVMSNFLEQQYQNHIHELQDVDDQIFHKLVQHGVVKKSNPKVSEVVNDMIKIELKNMFD